jgi:hypothetical protein
MAAGAGPPDHVKVVSDTGNSEHVMIVDFLIEE